VAITALGATCADANPIPDTVTLNATVDAVVAIPPPKLLNACSGPRLAPPHNDISDINTVNGT
jgi:hypothetical protein